MILLYAVARADDQRTAATAAEHGLQAHVDLGVAIFHRAVDRAPSPETGEVLEFGSVVSALAGVGAILPLRFGSVVEDRQALLDLTAERAAGWSALLDDLAGGSELIIHLPPPAPQAGAQGRPGEGATAADPPTGSEGRTQAGAGRAYLTARAAVAHAKSEQLGQLRRLPAVRDVRSLTRNRVSVLVRDPERACAQISQWVAAEGIGGVEVTGPWPPFSFCEAAT
jgi:hypothetical protein